MFLIKWKSKHAPNNSWEPKEHVSASAIAHYNQNNEKVNDIRIQNHPENSCDPWFMETDHLVDVNSSTEESYIPEALKLLEDCDNDDFIELTLNPEFESKVESCKKDSNCNRFYDTTCGMYVMNFTIEQQMTDACLIISMMMLSYLFI